MPNFTRQLIAGIRARLQPREPPYEQVLKWNRNQPRNPAGSTEGGQWVKGGTSFSTAARGGNPKERGMTHIKILGLAQEGASRGALARDRQLAGVTSIAPGMERDLGNAAYADVVGARDKASGFVNAPRAVGSAMQALLPAAPAPVVRVTSGPMSREATKTALQTGNVSEAKELKPGEHVNKTFIVTLDNGKKAVVKPEQGERMGDPGDPHFINPDIDRTIINENLTLAEREALAAEFSEAAKLDLLPVTISRKDIEGIPDDPYPHNPAGSPKGAMIQDFVEGLKEQGHGTLHEMRKLAIFDYAVGAMDRHNGNVFNDKDGNMLAMDNGYSFPDPTSPGVSAPRGIASDDTTPDVSASSSAAPYGTDTLQGMYEEYKEAAQERAEEDANDKMSDLWNEHVSEVNERVAEVREIWDELTEQHAKTIGERQAGQEHPVLPMGSKPPFERHVTDALEMNDILKEANIDTSAALSDDEKDKVYQLLREKIAAGATELNSFDEDNYREDHYQDWLEGHADTEARFIDEGIKTFTQWRDDEGYNQSPSGSSAPDPRAFTLITGEPDGFQFRSEPVRQRRGGDDLLMPEAERAPIREALENTDWKAFCDRHPNMTTGEREAFLGRIDRLKEALKTEDGLRALWRKQKLHVPRGGFWF